MAKLVLTRKGEWANRRQQYKVVIDGAEAGKIRNDESREFELAEGTHTIQCKYLWTSSDEKTFEIKEGKNTFLTVGSGMKLFLPLYILLVIGIFSPYIFRLMDKQVPAGLFTLQLILIVPALIYMLAYLTLFRKKYISISEDISNPFR